MFQAYFDRSELGDPAAVMAVSGYLSSDDRWQEFEQSWHRVLEAFGVLCENPADTALSKPSEEACLGNLSPV